MIQDIISYLSGYTDLARTSRFNAQFTIGTGIDSATGAATARPIFLQRYPNYSKGLSMQCEFAQMPGKSFAIYESRTYGPSMKYPYQSLYSDLSLTFLCTGNKTGAGGTLGGITGLLTGTALGGLAGTITSAISGNIKSNGMWEKKFFDDWMEYINPTAFNNTPGTYCVEYKNNYAATILLQNYDVVDTSGGLLGVAAGEAELLGQSAIRSVGGTVAGTIAGAATPYINSALGINGDTGTVNYGVSFIEAFPIAIEPIQLSWQNEDIIRLTVIFAYKKWERVGAPDMAAVSGNFGPIQGPTLNVLNGTKNDIQ